MLKREEYKLLPGSTGIYKFFNSKGAVIYVGKALNLKSRVSSYFGSNPKSTKTQALVYEISDIDYIEVPSEVEALILEANLIAKFKPRYNIALRDDKSFLYIVITKEEFPRLLTIRKNDNQVKVKYKYGPYPRSTSVRDVMKLLRRMFPYCTQSPKSKKTCFYWHIGLCNPCPAKIRKTLGAEYKHLKVTYLKNIKHIKDFLEGKLPAVINSLTKERDNYSKNQDFEKASRIQKTIKQLEYIRRPYYKISSFLGSSDFYKNEVTYDIDGLKNVLLPYYPSIHNLYKIEGIDISNILGESAVGSLVVFINGYQDPSLYRRFKIKIKGPNDVAQITEVLQRRLKNKQWQYPDLFMIDGGKPQTAAALSVLKDTNIPIIGLAKRFETIIIPHEGGFKSISLSRNDGALRLLQRIRDESHRFAQNYHHLLRKKRLDIIQL
ncbi:GIY-YIG nuclease family protein [Candidatus Gottesmanbacteria bacterium]|nr:GIY-YIG nuclease family protein [Candidatus Gottesmanbacteria bacterium]